MPALELIALFLLLCGSAYFALVESAVTALSAIRMKRLVAIDPKLYPYFHEWLATPHRVLSVLMVGNNMVNIAFSSVAAVAVLPLHGYFPSTAVSIVVWIVVTAMTLIFGEIVPKIVGRVYREPVTVLALPWLSRATKAFFFLWGPIGWAIKKWAPQFSQAPVNPLAVVSLEELQHAVQEGQQEGRITGESREMFQRALALHQKTAQEVAQPPEKMDTLPLEMLDRSGGRDLFIDLLVETGHTRVPVTRGGRVVGYVHVMDLLREAREGHSTDVEAMVRPIRRVRANRLASELLEEFRRSGDPVAIVESEEGAAVGFITLEDVLEEIVGEILDEYDLEQKA